MKEILKNWQLTGYWPYTPILNRSVETGVPLRGVTPTFTTEYPGDVYTILCANGEIPPMYYGKNAVSCEWVSSRWWLFEKEFFIAEKEDGKHWRLVIEGLDYEGDIHVNGRFVCHHQGPFVPLTIELDRYIKYNETNRLSITVYNTPDEFAQIGYTSRTSTQRSRYDYKWDFSTRLVGIGIYGPVWIEQVGDVVIEDAYVKPRLTEGDLWQIPADARIQAYEGCNATLKSELFFGEKPVAAGQTDVTLSPCENAVSCPLEVESPLLWWPNKRGAQPLYRLRLTLLIGNSVSHTKEYTIAFRTLEYRQADNSREDSLPYLPVVNGEPVYIKGVNLVPFDLTRKFPSAERYDQAIKMLADANVNLVRVWGGGILESDYFYTLCDRYGIMVWQEFIQSSSGIDNAPCTDPSFLRLLGCTAEAMIKQRRNHACLAFWSGGNELYVKDIVDGVPCNEHPVDYTNPNIAMLKELVQELDPDTFMLPSSPSGPNIAINHETKGANHDVHGPWMYYGERAHYAEFNRSDSILHSEFGCNGMSDMETLKDCLPPESLRVPSPFGDYIWNMHGGDWWDSVERDSGLFGPFAENETETLVKCSQFIQAEGIRYALQANLRRAMKNCGSIIWQFNEPWPNVACTSLTSYPLRPKLAYYFTKDAFSSCYASLRYDRLCWDHGEIFAAEVFAFNEIGTRSGTVVTEITDRAGTILYRSEYAVTASLACKAGEVKWEIPKTISGGFLVKTYWSEDDTALNEYLFLIKDENGLCCKKTVADYYDKHFGR